MTASRKWSTEAQRREAVDMLRDGVPAETVGRRFGYSQTWALLLARANGIRNRRGPRPSRRDNLLAEIFERLRRGEKQRHVTRAIGFNVSHLVWKARTGRVHLPELLALVGPARACRRRSSTNVTRRFAPSLASRDMLD